VHDSGDRKSTAKETAYMKFCVLMGSPRLDGNTAELVKPFIDELRKNGADVIYIRAE